MSAYEKAQTNSDLYKKHAARCEKDNLRSVCPSKLSKRELEDLYYSLLENNLELKKTINAQNDKNRILSTKVQRMTAQTKNYLTDKDCCAAGKAIIHEQKAAISDLTKANEAMADRIRRLSTQLCTAKQFLKQYPNARHSYKCYVATTASVKNLSTTSLQKTLDMNLKSLGTSARSAPAERDPPSARTAESKTSVNDVENEKMDTETVCNMNKCRSTMEDLQHKIEELEEELARTHAEYSCRMTQLENQVSELQAAAVRTRSDHGARARDDALQLARGLRDASADKAELETLLNIEKKKVAELEMRLKAAEVSQQVAQAIEGHTNTANRLEQKQLQQTSIQRYSVSSHMAAEDESQRPINMAASTRPNELTVSEDKRSKSDDWGYDDRRRESYSDEKSTPNTTAVTKRLKALTVPDDQLSKSDDSGYVDRRRESYSDEKPLPYTTVPTKRPNELIVPDDKLYKSDDSGYIDRRRGSYSVEKPILNTVASKRPIELTVPEDKLSKSDDSGYADRRRESYSDEKSIDETNQELIKKIAELQAQLDVLKLASAKKNYAEIESSSYRKDNTEIEASPCFNTLTPNENDEKWDEKKYENEQAIITKRPQISILEPESVSPNNTNSGQPDTKSDNNNIDNPERNDLDVSTRSGQIAKRDLDNSIEKRDETGSTHSDHSETTGCFTCKKRNKERSKSKSIDKSSDDVPESKNKRVSEVIFHNESDNRQSQEIKAKAPVSNISEESKTRRHSILPLSSNTENPNYQQIPGPVPARNDSISSKRSILSKPASDWKKLERTSTEVQKTKIEIEKSRPRTKDEYLDNNVKTLQDEIYNDDIKAYNNPKDQDNVVTDDGKNKSLLMKNQLPSSHCCHANNARNSVQGKQTQGNVETNVPPKSEQTKMKNDKIEVTNRKGTKFYQVNKSIKPVSNVIDEFSKPSVQEKKTQGHIGTFASSNGVQNTRKIDQNERRVSQGTNKFQVDKSKPVCKAANQDADKIGEFAICQNFATICTCPEKPSTSLSVFRSCSGTITVTSPPPNSRFRRCSCSDRPTRNSYGSVSRHVPIGTSTPKTQQRGVTPVSPFTYTLDTAGKHSRATSPDNTDNEISVLSDLPTEKDVTPRDVLSPGEHKTATTTTESYSFPNELTLSEGEVPVDNYPGRRMSKSVGEAPNPDSPVRNNSVGRMSLSSERKPSSEKMEAALQAISQELARCRWLLQRQRTREVTYGQSHT